MRFRRFKQKNYVDGTTLRVLYFEFKTRHAFNVIGLSLPEPEYDKTWTLIPTVTYHRDSSPVKGPNFTLKLKWLKWSLITLKWARYNPDENDYLLEDDYVHEKDADYLDDTPDTPQTVLDQEEWY